MDITLPLDDTAIERILPHRYPFLLVDRVTELEPDKRIVGIKNITLNERYLAHRAGEAPVLPPSVLTEAVVRRLRSRMGVLHGVARVDGKVAVEGTMTFALGPRNEPAPPTA